MKFLVFLLALVALTWCVGAEINNCDPCRCEGVDNVNKTLITCSGVNATHIYLNNKGITSVNANAFENNTALTQLWLYNNEISTIPDDFLDKNTNLTHLDLSENNISTIPDAFLKLNTLLTHLELWDNQISTIPADFLELNTELTRLDLDDNQISTIPSGFLAKNTLLAILWLNNNQISTVPDGFLDENTELTKLYLNEDPWNCLDCNVQDLGNKSAYNDYKTLDSNAYVAYCSNNASLGDIADAASNFTCTYSTTTTTTISTADLSNTYSMNFVLVYSKMILSDWNQTFLNKVIDQIAVALTVNPDNVVLEPVTEVQANRRRSVRRSSSGTQLEGTVTEFLTETAAFEGANTLRAIAPNLGADPNPTTTVTTFDGVLVPTPKSEDTKVLSTTEIILITVGGVVFSTFAGFAIYKGVQKYKGAKGYTYVFQA